MYLARRQRVVEGLLSARRRVGVALGGQQVAVAVDLGLVGHVSERLDCGIGALGERPVEQLAAFLGLCGLYLDSDPVRGVRRFDELLVVGRQHAAEGELGVHRHPPVGELSGDLAQGVVAPPEKAAAVEPDDAPDVV